MTPKSLLASIALPASVVARKSTLPIIECLRIADGRITGTDLERQISAAVDLDLRCCVPADRLTAALKALPADCDLRLDMQEQRLRVRGARSKFMLPTLPVEDFPQQEWVEPDVVIESPAELSAAIRTAEPAMAVHDVRYYLVGIGTHSGAVNGTNGHWVARHESSVLPDGIIIPAASVPMLLAALDEETVRYAVNERGLHVAANGYRMSTKLIEGRYPDVERVTPKTHGPECWEVVREGFIAAAASVHRMLGKERPGAEITIRDGVMRFHAENVGEEAETELACEGPSFRADFNLDYILAAARVLEGDALMLSTPRGQDGVLLMTGSNPAQRAAVMPMRIRP